MVRSGQSTQSGKQGGDRKTVSFRVDPATRTALEAEAERAGMRLGPYCQNILERQVAGESLDQLGDNLAELVSEQARLNEKVDQLAVGVFETLRTLLLNLTDIEEKDIEELRRRVLGR